MNQHELDCWRIERALVSAQYNLDQRDFNRFTEHFSEQGKLYRPTSATPLIGREEIAAAYAKNPAERFNRHTISNVFVSDISDNAAHSIAYVTLYSASQNEGGKPTFGWPVQRCLIGEYHDHWQRNGETWLITERRALFTIAMLQEA
ncbi:nuclear transport factor 2 family protein [Reinekea blandensis]|uniref:SnoaL-like domain-containing protein n=1 Tax=Reinekea blandensis MED297 TaxID=314283 RepID=A4BGZ0_9GAMM|nr:nuclear transport factor 2 family protein [Reinekea blandensis]EAR08636.1 hypothetical protein MED297_02990 [Reinekea sp. MED297] [Reinekea blandensis MED297]